MAQLQPSLHVLHDNIEFFKSLSGRLLTLEEFLAAITVKFKVLEDHANNIEQEFSLLQPEVTSLRTTMNIVLNIANTVQQSVVAIQTTVDNFGRDATANFATKLELEHTGLSSSKVASLKPKYPTPDTFSGKREDWQTTSRCILKPTNPSTPIPLIRFFSQSLTRLGNRPAFKNMQPFIPQFVKPLIERPLLITNYVVFMKATGDNFGIQNAHLVAEANLHNLQQKGSALDYTTKFLDIAADLSWNESALISQYRRGLKDSVQDMLALIDEPSTFTAFHDKAIGIDQRQFARHLEKKQGRWSGS